MAMKLIPTYADENGNTVTFVKLGAGYPGFSHRVIVNRVSVGLLSHDYRPSAKTAEFFLSEHRKSAGAGGEVCPTDRTGSVNLGLSSAT